MQTVRQITARVKKQINNVFKDRKKHVVVIVAEVVVVVLLVNMIITPHRSMAAFCMVYNRESAKLNNYSSDEQKLAMYRQLEAVSPDDIHSDVMYVRKGYESIVSSPNGAMSTGFAIMGSQQRMSDYEKDNCRYTE
jgi:hypothetical protein